MHLDVRAKSVHRSDIVSTEICIKNPDVSKLFDF